MKMESTFPNAVTYYQQRMRQALLDAEACRDAAFARRDFLRVRIDDEIARGVRTTLDGCSQTIRDQCIIKDAIYKAAIADVTWFLNWANAYANALQAELKILERHEQTTAGVRDAHASRSE
jgi:hypothetical protein